MVLSPAQLDTARRCQQGHHGLSFPLVKQTSAGYHFAAAPSTSRSASTAPLRGAIRPRSPETRLLRPRGRLVFLTHSVLVALCVPEEGGVAGDRLLRPQHDVTRIAWPGGRDRAPSQPQRLDTASCDPTRFEIEALHESLFPPPDATTPDFYDIVTDDWARRWPTEEIAWVAHRHGTHGSVDEVADNIGSGGRSDRSRSV